MTGVSRMNVSDARGVGRMLVDATSGLVAAVERMHATVQRRPGVIGQPDVKAARGVSGTVYRTIRGVMGVIGQGLDSALRHAEGMLPAGQSTPSRDVLVSIINGVYGDYLARAGNPLAIELELYWGDAVISVAERIPDAGRAARRVPTGRLLVMVHGLCMSTQQWIHEDQNPSATLADELGWTPLNLRYNSGLHVADNGKLLSERLERLVEQWPEPVEDLAIIGHSMGGLVARAACRSGEELQHGWLRRLRKLVFLGTPHHGVPLERGGHALDFLLDLSPYSAALTRVGKARSAGIQDLRHGTITRDRFHFVPLPKGVDCYALGAALASRRSVLANQLIGDGLVPLHSALGMHADPDRSLNFPASHQWVGYRMGHLELLYRPEVYAQIRAWLVDRESGPGPALVRGR